MNETRHDQGPVAGTTREDSSWYVIVADDSEQPSASRYTIRSGAGSTMRWRPFRYLALDISFTKDVQWAYSSMPSEDRPTAGP